MVHILVVEDEARIARFITKGLRQQQMEVTVVADGETALQLLQKQDFDIILLDLGLPGLSGWEVMEQLQQQQSNVPAVIMTALSEISNAERALAMGAIAYLQKPFSFAELLEIIQSHLR